MNSIKTNKKKVTTSTKKTTKRKSKPKQTPVVEPHTADTGTITLSVDDLLEIVDFLSNVKGGR